MLPIGRGKVKAFTRVVDILQAVFCSPAVRLTLTPCFDSGGKLGLQGTLTSFQVTFASISCGNVVWYEV